MNTMLNHDRDEDIEDLRARGSYAKDREITLGTTMLLGIFFALAVFGAVFFGFGYSMGAKHTMTVAASGEPGSSAAFNNFKPAPGNPLSAALAGANKPAGETVAAPFTPTPLAPAPGASRPQPAAVKPKDAEPADPDAGPIPDSSFSKPVLKAAAAAAAPAPLAPVTAAPPAQPGQFMVQVAAVSHQEDADLLVSTLKRRGYAVAVHSTAQDKLLHVQIGSFSNRKDADAMRQKLLADGFNAIVK